MSAPSTIAALISAATASPSRTTSFQRGYTERQPLAAAKTSSASDREEQEQRERERDGAARDEPLPVAGLGADVRLERGEVLAHRLAVVLDPLAEPRQPLGAVLDHAVDDVGDRALPGRQRLVGLRRPRARGRRRSRCRRPPQIDALGRHRRRGEDAAADQVEERRRELERARLAALPQQRRDERRLGVGRRLLLVLAVVAGLAARGRRTRTRRPRSRNAGIVPSRSR